VQVRSTKAIKFIVFLITVSVFGLLAFTGCSDKPGVKASRRPEDSTRTAFAKGNTSFTKAQKLHALLQAKSLPVTKAADEILMVNNRVDELAIQKKRSQNMVKSNNLQIDQLQKIIDGDDIKPGIRKELEESNAEIAELNTQKKALDIRYEKAQRLASDMQNQANAKLRLADSASGDEKVKFSKEGFELIRKSNAAVIEAQTLNNEIELLESKIAVGKPLNEKLQKDMRELEEQIASLGNSPDFIKLKGQLRNVTDQLDKSRTELSAAIKMLSSARSDYAKESEEVIALLMAAIEDYGKVRPKQLKSAAAERMATSYFWIGSVCEENVTLAMHAISIVECLPENTSGYDRIIEKIDSDKTKYSKRAFENYDLASEKYGQVKVSSEHACYIIKQQILAIHNKRELAEAIGEYDISGKAAELRDGLLEKARECDPDFSKTMIARLVDGTIDYTPVLAVDNTSYYEGERKKFQENKWPKLPAAEREEAVKGLLANLAAMEAEDTFDRQTYERILGPEKLKLENALKRGFEDLGDSGIADPNF
jgi:phage shock protein A